MKEETLKHIWKQEASKTIEGWDFSYLDGRWEMEPLPWNYEAIVNAHLKQTDRLLDMGTGDGNVLLQFMHAPKLTAVTEGYPVNYELCKRKLKPLGIRVEYVAADDVLPFDDESFDIIINRQESFRLDEVKRVLKAGGIFITQQVGYRNSRALAKRLGCAYETVNLTYALAYQCEMAQSLGFNVLEAHEKDAWLKFYDVGAVAYYAHIIEWEFENFNVERSFDGLLELQKELDDKGYVLSNEHRYLMVIQKP